MRRLLTSVICAAIVAIAVPAAPAAAIVRGSVDHNAHRYVGALLAPSGHTICSGVLVASQRFGSVFLTSAHCVGRGGNDQEVRITFGATVASGPTVTGTVHVMPGYVPSTFANDIAVVVLNRLTGILPVSLAHADTVLRRGTTVTTVGYGVSDVGVRKFATEIVTRSGSVWLNLLPGSGNSCNRDSGGPDLINPHPGHSSTPVVVALTDQGSCGRDQDFLVTGAAVHHFVDNLS